MRRRSFLLGVSAAAAGALTMRATAAGAAGRGTRSASQILASVKTSTLTPRQITPYVPPAGTAPAGVNSVGRADYPFIRDGRSLPTRVWYPVGPGPYPLLVFSHGMLSQPDDYAALLVSWALTGVVVAAPLYPHTSLGTAAFNAYDVANQPLDASAVLTQVAAQNTASGPLRGRIDASRMAAAGHSAGGITTVGMFSAYRDERLQAGIVLAGTDFLATPFTGAPAAMLFVHGRKDDTVSWSAGHTVFEAVPWSRAMLSFTDGGHQTSTAEFPTVSRGGAAFLRWALYGGTPALSAGSLATLEDQLSAARTSAGSAS
ncbi:alpha/beta hydrolase family protein [Paractinoplanes deccanensis]|uniref:alpha/beta hydrolase family protein n=1 Tax=Paractinoplanes deccanensis TaxID=113561 RepID=UPI00194152FF|nr:chlorophyllase [Actinoplanes deccanensis]